MAGETMARCVACGNPDWHPRGDWRTCTHCGLDVRGDISADRVADDLRAQLASGVGGPVRPGWRVDRPALRNVAWAFGYEQGPGWSVRPAVARPHAVTLAIMGRGREATAIAGQVAILSAWFARIVVLLDADAGGVDLRPAIVAEHPLNGDFAAQRNRLQELAGGGWVLQLDTDEMPSANLTAALGWLTAAADRDGLRSLGVPRRNLVDGVLSALYPDIQYRLNRADVRFAGVVHERPVVPFAETSLALAGAIEHRLSAERVRARSRVYEGMAPGGGRPADERALLCRYDGTSMAAR